MAGPAARVEHSCFQIRARNLLSMAATVVFALFLTLSLGLGLGLRASEHETIPCLQRQLLLPNVSGSGSHVCTVSTLTQPDDPTRTSIFNHPIGVVVDQNGTIYIAEQYSHRIRTVTPCYEFNTLAGSGHSGFADGTGTHATFFNPFGIALDAAGNLIVADWFNHRVRKVSTFGVVATIAGNGSAGFADGMNTTTSMFNFPSGVAVDKANIVYVADSFDSWFPDDERNNSWYPRIRKITPNGVISTLAGSSSTGFVDSFGNTARSYHPSGIALDGQGNIYVADYNSHCIRKITPSGNVITLAGRVAGFADGIGTSASFYYPLSIAVDSNGTIYVADQSNQRIRKVTPYGEVSTLAGNGNPGNVDGLGTNASFRNPAGIAVDASGVVYVADTDNGSIRLIHCSSAYTTERRS
jgi:streptogramin lyase